MIISRIQKLTVSIGIFGLCLLGANVVFGGQSSAAPIVGCGSLGEWGDWTVSIVAPAGVVMRENGRSLLVTCDDGGALETQDGRGVDLQVRCSGGAAHTATSWEGILVVACPDGTSMESYNTNWRQSQVGGQSGGPGSSVGARIDPAVIQADCEVAGGTWDSVGSKCIIDNDCSPQGSGSINKGNCGIVRYLVMAINTLSVVAGIVITASMIIAGIQYSSAGSDPQKTSAAKGRIRNAIIALLLFIFGYALLNWLVPGGVL